MMMVSDDHHASGMATGPPPPQPGLGPGPARGSLSSESRLESGVRVTSPGPTGRAPGWSLRIGLGIGTRRGRRLGLD